MATFNNGESLASVRTKINDAIDKIDGNATISNDISVSGNITVTGTVDGRDVAADGTKLDAIEASADVTDTANVTAAGALMDSELTSEASVKALDQGVATTDSPTFAGVDITGTLTSDGLTVDGAIQVNASVPSLVLEETDTTDINGQVSVVSGITHIRTINDAGNSVTNRLSVNNSTGDISFYETTGTTAKLTWSAADEELQLASGVALELNGWTITESGGSLYFATGGTNKMKLDASGNLQVVGNVEANATIS